MIIIRKNVRVITYLREINLWIFGCGKNFQFFNCENLPSFKDFSIFFWELKTFWKKQIFSIVKTWKFFYSTISITRLSKIAFNKQISPFQFFVLRKTFFRKLIWLKITWIFYSERLKKILIQILSFFSYQWLEFLIEILSICAGLVLSL